MTNRIAIAIGLALVVGAGVDLAVYDAAHLLFLGRRFYALLDWVAFWR